MIGSYNIEGTELYDINVTYPYEMPETYGAVGDGVTDDTAAIQSAINKQGLIVFDAKKTYSVSKTIRLKSDTVIDLNGSTILCSTKHLFFNFISGDTFSGYSGNGNITIKNGTIIGGAMSFIHAPNIKLINIDFRNSTNDHFLEICACKDLFVDRCSFVGMENLNTSVLEYINVDPCYFGPFPWNQNISSFYDGTINNRITICDCVFEIGSDSYAYGFNAIGVHVSDGSKHQNIRIINNKISGFTGCGLRINNMNNVVIANNIIELTASGSNGIRVGDVAKSTNVIIKGNVITASGTAITKSNSSTVFQASDNDINPTFA